MFSLLEGGSSTRRACLIDNDAEYIRIIKQINRWRREDNGFSLYDGDRLIASFVNKIRNQIVRYNVISGGYELQVPGLEANVADGRISFFGCNSVSIPFKFLGNGDVEFGNAVTTLVYCENDVDSYYTKAILGGKRFKQVADGFVLVDQYNYERIRFVSLLPSSSSYDYLGGKYRLQLPNGGIRLTINDGVFTLAGCNTFTFKFTLADNGNMIFGAPSGINKQCEVDYDRVFLNYLLRTQTIAVFEKVIFFTTFEGELVAKAINFDGK